MTTSRQNLVQVHLPRTGLGHALVSYSRAFCYHADELAQFVHPIWFKIRVGPYLRREADKRNYHRIIRTPVGWGLPVGRMVRRLAMKVVSEDTFDPTSSGQYLVVRDDGPLHPRTLGAFARLNRHREYFIRALESITVVAAKVNTGSTFPTIGIFHRSGDMKSLRPVTGDERKLRTHGYGYYPPEYSADALRHVRHIAGWQVPAVLSTDAPISEVEPILREGNVHVSTTKSALANMLEMRHHQVLIMGTSMYAKWSWFLGDAFAITPRYKDTVCNLLNIPERSFAWFVFPDETSLNGHEHRREIEVRLERPRSDKHLPIRANQSS